MIGFSIGLVYYNQKEWFQKAVQNLLLQQCDAPFEILIRDQSENNEAYTWIQQEYKNLVASEKIKIWKAENLMHSGGHNFLWTQKQYGYYICASIDMEYEANMLLSFTNAIEQNPNQKLFGGKLLQPNKTHIDSVGIEKTWYGRIYEKGFGEDAAKYTSPAFVWGISGALFCLHHSALSKNELLFEPTLHYKNDGELMYRLNTKGIKGYYIPKVMGVHQRTASSNTTKDLWIIQSSLQGQIFMMKHLSCIEKIPAYFLLAVQWIRLQIRVVKK